MSGEIHPKSYEPSAFWWLSKPKYLAIFLRELSSVFIILYAVLYSLMLFQLRTGEQAYRNFLSLMATPPFLALSVLILFFAVYHSVTFFLLLPKTRLRPLKVGGREITGSKVLVVFIPLWLIASYLVTILIFVG